MTALFARLALPLLLGLSGCHGRPEGRAAGRAAAGDFELTLLHINDMHARYEETNQFSGTCSAKDSAAGNCYGGHARVATVMKQARQQEADGETNTIVLNAGDNFQGTVYYSIFKWNISLAFVNLLHFDALTLGNHEFDDHTSGLLPYVANLAAPLAVANADFSQEPSLAALNIPKSVVIERAGTKIGIVGYLTPETAFLASPDRVTFQDEVEAVTAEVARLKQAGVNIIIGLGHSGYEKDQEIAAKVPDIDLVVGGHSHTFLYTGPQQPDVDVPAGLYPTWVDQGAGRRVPVVQAYAFTKYMGKLTLRFDADGELVELKGGPILLNKDVPQDPDTLAEVERWKEELSRYVDKPIGRTAVVLDGRHSRQEETNLGDLISDAFVFARAEFLTIKDAWTDGPIALVNGGSICQCSIDATKKNGTITVRDVMQAMPHSNLVVLLKLRGSVLLDALEHGVSEYVVGNAWQGKFLQFSGLRVEYDVSQPPGSRVVSALARCGQCLVPTYEAVDPEALYGVLVNGFLANGGDGFTMLANNEGSEVLQDTDDIVVQDFIRKKGLVHPVVEGRITFVGADSSTAAPTTSATAPDGARPEATTPKSSGTSPAPLRELLVVVLVAALSVSMRSST